MRTERIKCNYCGRFISLEDLKKEKAYITMITPDSYFTKEEYETVCKKCK